MNEVKIEVRFEKGVIYKPKVYLKTNDYNSTKLIFIFDKEGKKIFKMKSPSGKTILLEEIKNNELILGGTDKDGKTISLFNESGYYTFEISLYGDNSKLTSVSATLPVQKEEIPIDGEVIAQYLPIFDELINTLKDSIDQVNNLDISILKEETTTTVTITKKDGSEETVEILDGATGPKGKDGTDGKTPIKGTDYWTDSDKQEIVDDTTNTLTPVLNQNLQTSKQYTDNQIVNDIKEVIYDEASATFTFVKHDNTTIVVDLPIETMVKSGYYDEETKELVLVLENNQEIRIPASGLIDDYTGQDTVTIQCNISAENIITCNIKSGSISKTLLTAELQSELNNKVNSDVLNNYDTSSEVTSKITTATPYASETAKGMIKVWTSTNEEGEIGLNISTEV